MVPIKTCSCSFDLKDGRQDTFRASVTTSNPLNTSRYHSMPRKPIMLVRNPESRDRGYRKTSGAPYTLRGTFNPLSTSVECRLTRGSEVAASRAHLRSLTFADPENSRRPRGIRSQHPKRLITSYGRPTPAAPASEHLGPLVIDTDRTPAPPAMSQSGTSPAAPGNLRELLRSRKRAQKPGSCEPCRERKVRCDKEHPCATCDKRGYPDLCVYPAAEPGRRRSILNARRNESTASPVPGGGVMDADAATPAPGPEPHYTPASLAGSGGIIASPLPGTTIPSPTHDTSPTNDTSAHRTAFSLGILPLLGAGSETDNAATDGAWRGTLAQLSTEHGALDLFLWYRRQVHPFYAIPLDVDDIEKKFCLLLNLCDDSGGGGGPEPVRDPNWLCLLNAILAAGAQASEMPLERRLTMSRLHS